MDNEYGSVTITCKRCKAVYVLEDAGNVERMTGYICPGCGEKMKSRELAWLKGMYYLRLSQGLSRKPMRELHRAFQCKIDLGYYFQK